MTRACWLMVVVLQVAVAQPQLPPMPAALAEAAAPLLQAVADSSADASAWGELGMFYQAHEYYPSASQAYAQARNLAPDAQQWWYLAGVVAEAQGDTATAATLLQQALALAPNAEPAAVRLAILKRLDGDTATATELLRRVLATHDSAGAHAQLGQLALAAGQWPEAVRHLQQALALQPAARTLHHPLAVALRNTGDVVQARQALAQAGPGTPRMDDPWMDRMQRMSRSAAFYMSQGLAAVRSGDLQAAVALLATAVATDPENLLAAVNLARVQENLGQLDTAQQTLKQVLVSDPGYAPAHLNLGVLEELASRDEQALEHYLRAIQLDPTLFQARLLAANAALRQGQASLAQDQYAAALVLQPDRDELRFRRTIALAAIDCQGAIVSALELVRRLPEDLEVLTLYIRVVSGCPQAPGQDVQNALNASRNVHRLTPAWPAIETRAMAEAAAGNFDQAVALQTQILASVDLPEATAASLTAHLALYQAGQIVRDPFASVRQLTQPRRLTPADRR